MNSFRCKLWITLVTPATIPFALLGILFRPFPFKIRYWIVTRWTHFALWLLSHLCGLRYRVEGLENIPHQSAVILSKHQSVWETFAFQAIFPPQVWVLKRELLRIPFFGWGLKVLEPVAIDRSHGRQAAEQLLKQGRNRLTRGIWIIIFPEGTRAAVGEHKCFKSGGARLAVDAGVPIIPVAHNAGIFWPKGQLPRRPGTITVAIGAPIDTSHRSIEDINQEAGNWIKKRTRELEATALEEIKS